MKEECRYVVSRVDRSAVRQSGATVAADTSSRRVVPIVDHQEVRRTVGMLFQLEAVELERQRLKQQSQSNITAPVLELTYKNCGVSCRNV